MLNVVTKVQKHQKKKNFHDELSKWERQMQTTCPRKWFWALFILYGSETILYDGEKPPFKGSFRLEPTALVTHKCSAAGSE